MKDKYDVIIIGASIGGLVCGCYLAKSGLKALILEKSDKPGGYCSSFIRDGFLFDAGPHSFGSCRPHGQIGRVIKKLNLENDIILKRKSISNIVITPDYKIHFGNDRNNIISELHKAFPKEKANVKLFFDFILNRNIPLLHSKIKSMTFDKLLGSVFGDTRLKAILGMLVGNLGLSPKNAAAFTSAILYRERILDGGYYPEGGMQNFSNALLQKFKSLGGTISLLSEADSIVIKNRKAKGVI